MEESFIQRVVEAALLASSTPLSVNQLQSVFGEEGAVPAGSVERALERLAEHNEARGVQLIEVASGFRFQVAEDVHGHVARLWAERPARYSRALLETLALIAYRQPITRGEIEQIRGVAVSTGIIKTLEEREWIRIVGHRDVPGKPALFGTTRSFLDYFGLRSLDQLPPLSELQDIPELEPELPLEPVTVTAGRASLHADAATSVEHAEAADIVTDSSASEPAESADSAQTPPSDAAGEPRPTQNDASTQTSAVATSEHDHD